MKTTLVFLVASTILVAFVGLASTSASPLMRMAWGLAASLVAFLIGLGCGERSHAAYSDRLFLANQQLTEELRSLQEKQAASTGQGRTPTKHGPGASKRYRDTGHDA